jgi:hypothetical protein
MIAGPGAAYICDNCLQLCNELLQDTAPFSTRALELASRPPIVVAAPSAPPEGSESTAPAEPTRTVVLELEQKQNGLTLILHRLLYYTAHIELHYLWIRPPLARGFSFIPRLIFLLEDNIGNRWAGDRGGMLLARPDLTDEPENTVYQGSARFRPLPPPETRSLKISAADPLGIFDTPPAVPWNFEVTLL